MSACIKNPEKMKQIQVHPKAHKKKNKPNSKLVEINSKTHGDN